MIFLWGFQTESLEGSGVHRGQGISSCSPHWVPQMSHIVQSVLSSGAWNDLQASGFSFPLSESGKEESGYAQVAQGVRRGFEGPGWRRVPCWHGDSAWESWIHAIIFCSWGRKGKSYILRFSQIKMRNKSIPFCHWPRALTQNDSRSQSFLRQRMQ